MYSACVPIAAFCIHVIFAYSDADPIAVFHPHVIFAWSAFDQIHVLFSPDVLPLSATVPIAVFCVPIPLDIRANAPIPTFALALAELFWRAACPIATLLRTFQPHLPIVKLLINASHPVISRSAVGVVVPTPTLPHTNPTSELFLVQFTSPKTGLPETLNPRTA